MERVLEAPSLRMLWTAVSGQVHAPPVLGSVVIYAVAVLSCLLLQRACKLVLPRRLYSYAADFCVTLLICCFPYGHGAMRRHYGHSGYVISAVTMVTFALLVVEGVASPLGVFTRYLRGRESLWGLGVRVVLQVMAACLAYRLVITVCLLQLTRDHEMLLQGTCETDLKVPVLVGCLIEFCSVLYDTWLGHQQLCKHPLLDTLVKNINGALLVSAGVHLTGMYMHPAMATGMSFNCKGSNLRDHMAVYWLAAFLGCYVGVKMTAVLRLPSATAANKKDQGKANGNGVTSAAVSERRSKNSSRAAVSKDQSKKNVSSNAKLTKRHSRNK